MFLPLLYNATSEALDTERAEGPTLKPGLSNCRLLDSMLASFNPFGVDILFSSPVSDLRSPIASFDMSLWIDLFCVRVWFFALYIELLRSSDEAASLEFTLRLLALLWPEYVYSILYCLCMAPFLPASRLTTLLTLLPYSFFGWTYSLEIINFSLFILI